jgi:hypothetical protein
MMIVKADKRTEAGEMPSEKDLATMGKYNQELIDAGVMVDGAGLQPSSKGARVGLKDGKVVVTDGPFAETKETLGGYYLVECESLDEAIAIAGRIPSARYGSIEVRPVMQH